jgi:hypothetical protein
MKQENFIKILAISTIVVLILIIWMLLKLNRLEKEISRNVLSSLPSLSQREFTDIITPPEQKPPAVADTAVTIDKIPTAITFTTLSSPTLQPQTLVNIAVEQVARSEDGAVTVGLRIFTGEATAYSALDVNNYFALVDLERGEFQLPSEIKGSFGSMPPRSATTGQVIFRGIVKKSKIIIQIGPNDNPKFYEFDFTKGAYKETLIG